MTAAPSSTLVRVVFGALVVATAAAFVITQRLKHGPSPVKRVFYAQWVSPNGDGRKDSVYMRFDLPEPARVLVAVVSDGGGTVRRLVDGRRLGRGTHRFRWDGRTGEDRVAPNGRYRLRVSLLDEGRSLTAARTLTVDTMPPRPRLVEVTPATAAPGARPPLDRARIRFEAPANPPARVTVYRTDGDRVRAVQRLRARRGRRSLLWPLTVAGRPAPDGSYAFGLTAEDSAGNLGAAPLRLPPTSESAARGTGLTVRRLGLGGPLEPVRAGGVARLSTGPLAPRLSWTFRRAGSPRVLARGRTAGRSFALRVPRRARTGLHVIGVRGAGIRAAWPLAVRGRPVGGGRPRAMVLLPVLTWLGENPVDADADGFGDTLPSTGLAAIRAPFASGSLPPGVREVTPVLGLLDRERASYDLTTDLALLRDPRGLGGMRGVLLAGSMRWAPEPLAERLRAFAEGGGRVGALGADALRRGVEVRGAALTRPTPPRTENPFGERVAGYSGPPIALTVFTDELGLLTGTGGVLSPSAPLDESLGLPEGATRLSAAGRDPTRPAVVAYRIAGGGLVIRLGANRIGARADDPAVAAVVGRAWELISR